MNSCSEFENNIFIYHFVEFDSLPGAPMPSPNPKTLCSKLCRELDELWEKVHNSDITIGDIEKIRSKAKHILSVLEKGNKNE